MHSSVDFLFYSDVVVQSSCLSLLGAAERPATEAIIPLRPDKSIDGKQPQLSLLEKYQTAAVAR